MVGRENRLICNTYVNAKCTPSHTKKKINKKNANTVKKTDFSFTPIVKSSGYSFFSVYFDEKKAIKLINKQTTNTKAKKSPASCFSRYGQRLMARWRQPTEMRPICIHEQRDHAMTTTTETIRRWSLRSPWALTNDWIEIWTVNER